MADTTRSEFTEVTYYSAPCPKCGHKHGYVGKPHNGDRIGCDCGTRLVVKQGWSSAWPWVWYLEIDSPQ